VQLITTILLISGFLNLETDDVSGNLGLKDQTQAMIWVKENIHYFGGIYQSALSNS
jgi:carboxylesterase type B